MKTDHFIGFRSSGNVVERFSVTSAISGDKLPGNFPKASFDEVNQSLELSQEAFRSYSSTSGKDRGRFLRQIAIQIEQLGDELIDRIHQEAGLKISRIRGEKVRTINQLLQFAKLVEDGHWVNATIDKSDESGSSDLRKMLVPIGPVVVFGAGNFPLAYSTAGGDTAAALAAGNTVIVKAHPNHAGTNALIAEAIIEAAKNTGMPDGVFSTLYDDSHDVGSALVMHKLTKAVGFTGSEKGGRALMNLANSRSEPIPVFAEMGSTNPMFLLNEPDMGLDELAALLGNAITNDMGQFCTKPGIIFLLDNDFGAEVKARLIRTLKKVEGGVFLNAGIESNFNRRRSIVNSCGVEWLLGHVLNSERGENQPMLAETTVANFIQHHELCEEIFGPLSLIVLCSSYEEMLKGAETLNGQLTASIIGQDATIISQSNLLQVLQEKAGRIIFNGVPTGVRVCAAMNHGGPYPASSDVRFTAVGSDSISRFTRPVTFQNCKQELLPPELRDGNPLKIIRRENGELVVINQ